MGRIRLDLHNIFNNSRALDEALNKALDDAIEKRIPEIEIIHGKGSGQLQKKVLKFLERKEIKQFGGRIKKDPKNHGRIFIHFRF